MKPLPHPHLIVRLVRLLTRVREATFLMSGRDVAIAAPRRTRRARNRAGSVYPGASEHVFCPCLPRQDDRD